MLYSVYSHFLVIVRLTVTGLKLSNHCSDPDHSVTEEWIKIFRNYTLYSSNVIRSWLICLAELVLTC